MKNDPPCPYTCQALRATRAKERIPFVNRKVYTFDVSKADQIFNILLKDKQLKLSDDHRVLKTHEIKYQKYCKFHNNFGHVTNEYMHFRDIIQKGLTEGRLKFADKKPV